MGDAEVTAALAPGQETMGGAGPWWKGTKYDFVKGTPSFWTNGIPWSTFEEEKPPLVYQPPQWKPGYLCGSFNGLCQMCNWWQMRSPMCSSPCVPCCCAWCITKCVPNNERVSMTDPDAWMMKMLNAGTHPKCPENMKGIFWLCDNNAPHEQIFCFHDADWVTDKIALKTYYLNFGVAATAEGAVTLLGAGLTGAMLRIEVSPNGKWVSIAGGSTPGWMYVPQRGDKFECKGEYAPELYGASLPLDVGNELMRLSHDDETQPLSAPNYQYRVRRIAYLDERGQLVKTQAYEDIKKRGTEPFKAGFEPSCCGYCFCLGKDALALGNYPQVSEDFVVRYATEKAG